MCSSSTTVTIPTASARAPARRALPQIEQLFESYYTQASALPFKGTDFSGRSDYGPFIAVGIPSGGLFTGAEGIKTADEAALWGGTAGQPYDPCYHLACDTFANVNDASARRELPTRWPTRRCGSR